MTRDSPLEIFAEALKFLESLLCSLENLLPQEQFHEVGTDILTATGYADLLVHLHCTPEKRSQHRSY